MSLFLTLTVWKQYIDPHVVHQCAIENRIILLAGHVSTETVRWL